VFSDLKKMKMFCDKMPCTYLKIPEGGLPCSVWLFVIVKGGTGLYARLETFAKKVLKMIRSSAGLCRCFDPE
jgi:hypothetical protein